MKNALPRFLFATLTDVPTSKGDLVVLPPDPLADLKTEALRAHAGVTTGLSASLAEAVAAGKALTAMKRLVKEQLGAGYWEDYVAENFPFSPRTAQNYMRLAKNEAKLAQDLVPNRTGNAAFQRTHALKALARVNYKGRGKRS